ncbi:MAG TPA: pyridoxal phosphate-dependent aminotransferase [Candidatus Sulfotelmatobacter sp.]|nr:pyridoxal phosphate-dependent aminotransferase [Candidatus Sulfotelmatobacter sp.]
MFSDRTNWRLSPNRFTQAVEEVRARGSKILDLTVSNPTRVGLEYDLDVILAAFSSAKMLDYDPQAKGLLSARQAVTRYYRERDVASNVTADAENIVLTTSTSEGYSFVFRLLCNPGDEVLVPKPSYPLFEFLADLQDVKLVPYPLIYDHGWQIDFHSLEKAVSPRTRAAVVVHPNNPTGSYAKPGEIEMLNSICRKRDLALIVDEVFLDYELNHVATAAPGYPVGRSSTRSPAASSESEPYGSFAHNQDVLTFTLSGLSKISVLPQMKVAWIVTNGPRAQAASAMERLEVIADTYLSMNAPIQWAVPTLLQQRRRIQRQLLQRVEANLTEMDRQLSSQKICQRLEIEGGWYAVLRVPVMRSDEELAIELVREQCVLVHPGHFYDFPGDGYLILSLIGELEEFRQGVSRVLNCFQE